MKQTILLITDLFDKIFGILNKKQRVQTVLVFFLTLIGAFMEVIGVSAVLPLVQAMIYPNQLRQNAVVKQIVDILHIDNDIQL